MFLVPSILREVLYVSWGTIFLREFPLEEADNPCAPASSAAFSVIVSTTNCGCDLEVATVVIKPEEIKCC